MAEFREIIRYKVFSFRDFGSVPEAQEAFPMFTLTTQHLTRFADQVNLDKGNSEQCASSVTWRKTR
jgi:hypothetical protein